MLPSQVHKITFWVFLQYNMLSHYKILVETPLNSFPKPVNVLIVESNTENPILVQVGAPLFYMELLIAILSRCLFS